MCAPRLGDGVSGFSPSGQVSMEVRIRAVCLGLREATEVGQGHSAKLSWELCEGVVSVRLLAPQPQACKCSLHRAPCLAQPDRKARRSQAPWKPKRKRALAIGLPQAGTIETDCADTQIGFESFWVVPRCGKTNN